MKWTWKDFLFIGIITLIVLAFFYRLFWPTPHLIITPDFGQSDAVSAISVKFFYSRNIRQFHIPLWTSAIGGGYPLFALGTMATFFIPNLIFFTLLNPVLAYNVTLVLSVALLGWGMYVWLRCIGYQKISCLFGSITVVLSGYCITQLIHITIVQSYCLFPWLAALTVYVSQKKSLLTIGLFILVLSQQIVIGFPQCVFITLLFLSVYWLWLIRASTNKLKQLFLFGSSVIGGCVIAAVQILPSLEYLKTLVTAHGFSLEQAIYYSYPFQHILTLFNPFALGNPATGTYPYFSDFSGSIFWENTAYIGIIPLVVLAIYLIGVLRKKHLDPPIAFFLLVTIASFLLMIGMRSPLYLFYSSWPLNIFRVPSRFIWLFEISLIVMSTHAFDHLISNFKKSNFFLLFTVFVIFGHTFSLFSVWFSYHKLQPASQFLAAPPITQYVDRTRYTLSIGAEYLYNSLYKAQGWQARQNEKDPTLFLQNTLTPDKNILWNVPQIKDYTGRAIRRSDVLNNLLSQSISSSATDATISATGQKIISLLSIKNVISALPLTHQGLSLQKQVSFGNTTIRLYNNPEALPTVYVAKYAIPVHTVEDAVAAFSKDSFVPGDSALVEFDATPAANIIQNTPTLVSPEEDKYVVDVRDLHEKSILVLTQTYYPGWHASIDSKEIPIFPVNIKHIGAIVPKGNHAVVFWYMPNSFVYGAWISGISLFIIMSLTVFGFVHSVWNTRRKVSAPAPRHQDNPDR
jgi:hypothetical protein